MQLRSEWHARVAASGSEREGGRGPSEKIPGRDLEPRLVALRESLLAERGLHLDAHGHERLDERARHAERLVGPRQRRREPVGPGPPVLTRLDVDVEDALPDRWGRGRFRGQPAVGTRGPDSERELPRHAPEGVADDPREADRVARAVGAALGVEHDVVRPGYPAAREVRAIERPAPGVGQEEVHVAPALGDDDPRRPVGVARGGLDARRPVGAGERGAEILIRVRADADARAFDGLPRPEGRHPDEEPVALALGRETEVGYGDHGLVARPAPVGRACLDPVDAQGAPRVGERAVRREFPGKEPVEVHGRRAGLVPGEREREGVFAEGAARG